MTNSYLAAGDTVNMICLIPLCVIHQMSYVVSEWSSTSFATKKKNNNVVYYFLIGSASKLRTKFINYIMWLGGTRDLKYNNNNNNIKGGA